MEGFYSRQRHTVALWEGDHIKRMGTVGRGRGGRVM